MGNKLKSKIFKIHMRFAFLLAAAAAVQLKTKTESLSLMLIQQSAADIINACDSSGNGKISKAEAHACIDAHVPADHQAEAHAEVEEVWDAVDTSGDGEVDEHELAAA